jgi:hypothetical protein
MLCYVMLCYVMLCYVMWCNVIVLTGRVRAYLTTFIEYHVRFVPGRFWYRPLRTLPSAATIPRELLLRPGCTRGPGTHVWLDGRRRLPLLLSELTRRT